MKYLLYVILFLVLTTACKKETTVVIQAQNYLNLTDGSGYSGGSYRIVETESSFYTNPSEVIKTGFLDENGHASFDIKINNNKKNIVSITKPDNICYTEFLNQHLTDESSNTVNFK